MLKGKTKTASILGLGLASAFVIAGATPAMATPAPAPNLVGSGCADYQAAYPHGQASIKKAAKKTTSEAIAANPWLTEFSSAISGGFNSDVDIEETIDNGDFTVFAPINQAFDDLDPATLANLKSNSDTLISTLIYHISPGQIQTGDIVGVHPTIQGSDITVTGSGNNLSINNGEAYIVCGGIKTSTGTIYLIDSVLTPPVSETPPEETVAE